MSVMRLHHRNPSMALSYWKGLWEGLLMTRKHFQALAEALRCSILTSIGIDLIWLVGLVTTRPRLTTIDRTSGVGIMGGISSPFLWAKIFICISNRY